MPKNKRRYYILIAILLVAGFLLLMGVLIYRVFTDGMVLPFARVEPPAPVSGTVIPTSYGDIPLTSDQVKTIESLGVDVESLPEKITPELEECVRLRLGDERIEEIIKSGNFGAFDALKVAPCL